MFSTVTQLPLLLLEGLLTLTLNAGKASCSLPLCRGLCDLAFIPSVLKSHQRWGIHCAGHLVGPVRVETHVLRFWEVFLYVSLISSSFLLYSPFLEFLLIGYASRLSLKFSL